MNGVFLSCGLQNFEVMAWGHWVYSFLFTGAKPSFENLEAAHSEWRVIFWPGLLGPAKY